MLQDKRISLFCIVTSLFWFSLYTYVPTLSTYSESLGASYKLIGLITGSYGLTQLLLRVPLGILSDKLNKRKIFIIAGIIISMISSIGLFFFRDPIAVLVFRALSGGAATTWVTFTVLFSSYYKSEDAPKAIGIINSYNYLGQVIATLLGPLVVQKFGYQGSFALSLVSAVVAIILGLGIAENKEVNRKPLKSVELLLVAKDKSLLLVSSLAVFSQFVSFATVYGFTPIIAKEIGASSFQLGLLVTVATLPRVFASYLSGVVFNKYLGDKGTLVAGFLVSAISCVATPFIGLYGNLELLFLNQIIGGLGQGVALPMLMGLSIKQVEESKRATAMGFFQAIYSLGMFAGPTLVGVVSDFFGLMWGFMFTALISLMGALLGLSLKEKIVN